MNCLEKKASEKFEQEALSFYIALANAFRPEETQEEVPRIHLQPEDDFAETVCAMRRECKSCVRMRQASFMRMI